MLPPAATICSNWRIASFAVGWLTSRMSAPESRARQEKRGNDCLPALPRPGPPCLARPWLPGPACQSKPRLAQSCHKPCPWHGLSAPARKASHKSSIGGYGQARIALGRPGSLARPRGRNSRKVVFEKRRGTAPAGDLRPAAFGSPGVRFPGPERGGIMSRPVNQSASWGKLANLFQACSLRRLNKYFNELANDGMVCIIPIKFTPVS